MKQQEVGRVAIRAHFIILSADGYGAQDIAEIHRTSDVTVYQWLDRFDEEGPAGLYDRPRAGRPPKIDEEARTVIEDTMEQPPHQTGYNFTTWTVPLLTRHLETLLNLDLHTETVRLALQELGFCWSRPRWAAPHDDPQTAERMWAIYEAVMQAADQTVVLLEDETIFKRLPPLRGMWMRCGQQRRILTPPHNEDFCLYGTLELHTGQWTQARFDKANSDATLSFLAQLNARYPDQSILLIWDQASYHTSQRVETWLAAHPRFTVLLLPARSPQLNPVEAIWRLLKDRVAANLVRSLDAIFAACNAFFQELDSSDLLRCAGLIPG
jgi:transposase